MEETKKTTVRFAQHEYHFEKNEATWQLELKKSEVAVQDEKELLIIGLEHPLLLPSDMVWEEDQVQFTYTLKPEYQAFAEVQTLPKAEKLRAAINMAQAEELLGMPLTFFIAPENVVFDRNLLPKIAYRGLKGKMAPENLDTDHFLRQYKSFIIALFSPKDHFQDLYDGQLEIVKGSSFISQIKKANSVAEIKEYLEKVYQETIVENRQRLRTVTRKKYRIFQQCTIWMSLLALLLLIPLSYYAFSYSPFQAKMLKADTAFLKKDYNGTIDTLAKVKTKKIPYTQKYELAMSYVEVAQLSDKQKATIFNNLSLKAKETYLSYWIEIGRGNFDQSLDLAKDLEDLDLILYGLYQKMQQVKNDPKLSGTEKEKQINELEESYKKYEEQRNKKVNGSESTDKSDKTDQKDDGSLTGGQK